MWLFSIMKKYCFVKKLEFRIHSTNLRASLLNLRDKIWPWYDEIFDQNKLQ